MKTLNFVVNNSLREMSDNNVNEARLNPNVFYKEYLKPALEDMFENMTMDHVSDPSEADFLKACKTFADYYFHL